MHFRSATSRALVSFAVPGGVLLLVMTVLLHWSVLPLSSSPLVDFYRYAVLIAGLTLAWRFSSSQTFFAVLLLVLAAAGMRLAGGRGTVEVARNAIGLLLPINLVVLSFGRRPGFNPGMTVRRAAALFVQAVAVVVISRPEQDINLKWLEYPVFPAGLFSWTGLPQPILAVFFAGLAMLLTQYVLHHRSVDRACFWALVAAALGLRLGESSRMASAYLTTGGLILVIAVVETSYAMAFHDELTGLPSRRAFNHALLALGEQYTVGMADVDHFKQFNDLYGHDTGDQVLRLVASRMAHSAAGGQVFRCGGEEFAVVFPGKSVREALPAAEAMRKSVEDASFVVRGPDRSQRSRPERRHEPNRRRGQGGPKRVGVTVSIGLAEPRGQMDPPHVVRAADHALYTAKENGRNRVEVAGRPGAKTVNRGSRG